MQVLLGYDAHEAAVAELGEAVAELTGSRRDAERLVDRLLDGGWSGAAAESFGVAWRDWLVGEGQVRDALATIQRALVATGRDLTARDGEADAALGRLAARLGR